MDATAASPRRADPRRQITAAVFVAVALGTVGLFAAITVAPLAAVELTGTSRLSGVPTAAALAGTATGAAILARVMARRGRRPGLVLGFGLGAAGAVVAVLSVVLGLFWSFVVGMLVLGCGNGANLQARYAVADVQPSERRTTVLGWVVWAGTIGAVVGPSLVDPAGLTLAAWGLPALAGGAAIAALGMALSASVCSAFLRPDPAELAEPAPPDATPGSDDEPAAVVDGWGSPVVIVAVVAMVAGQFVMVLIMTMTPVHASGAGASLGAVGFIMSAHIVGMYGLTPVAGLLADRVGSVAVIAVGLALTVVAGLLGAVVPAADVMLLSVALFILGLGWSFGFVAASGLLAAGVASAERARLQGSVDTAVYAAATLGSLGSGVLIAAAGYAALCLVGAALVSVPAVVLARLWRPVRSAVRPA
ncbi:MAG TPA: MFS transporter [Euzebyales bacterium]